MANNIIRRTWKQSGLVNIEDLRGSAFQAEQGSHTFLISGVDENGEALALSGTPAGVLLRSDGQDVALTCSVSDGIVSATLPANAYVVPGRVGITIFLTNNGQKVAIYAAVGSVATTSSGTVAPPAGSDVVDLVNAIATAVATIPASYTDLMAAVAPTYSTSALYAVGSYAWYDGVLKRCIVPITTAESYTAAHWTNANLGSDVSDLKSAIGVVPFGKTLQGQIDSIDGKIGTTTLPTTAQTLTGAIAEHESDIISQQDQITEAKNAVDGITVVKHSRNLLNYDTILEGKALDYNSAHTTYGEPVSDSPSITTDYIPVVAGKTYYSTKAGSIAARDKMALSRYAYYYSDKSLLSYAGDSNTGIITAPENAAYMRATLRNTTTPWTKQLAESAKWMIYEFDALYYQGMPYEDYTEHTAVESTVIDTKRNLDNLFSISKNKNLFTYSKIIDYAKLKTADGTITTDSTGCATEFIECKANTDYYISKENQTGIRQRSPANEICFYNNTKTFISATTNAYTFTTPSNTKYIRISWHNNNGVTSSKISTEKQMLEEGTSYTMFVSPDGEYRIDQDLFDWNTKETLSNDRFLFEARKRVQPAKRLMTVAHRGVMSGIPSNTVPAFEYAAQHGCDYVEFDIRKTSDGEYVIYHDKQITIGGATKDVLEFTLDEIKTYRFSSYAGTAYEDTEIPTLDEALQCIIKNNVYACVELKNSAEELSTQDIQDIYDIFSEYGMEYTTWFTTDTESHKEHLLNINPYLMVTVNFKQASGITVDSVAAKIRALSNNKNIIACALPVELITSANIATLKGAGASVFFVGAGLGGSIDLPDSMLKYVHLKMVELTVS